MLWSLLLQGGDQESNLAANKSKEHRMASG